MRVVFLFFLLFSLPAAAVDFTVLGRGGAELYRASEKISVPQTAGAVTIRFLERAKREQKLDYEGSASGILTIQGLGSEGRWVSNQEFQAFGWCYSINGFSPEFMPDAAVIYDSEAKLTWFYAFSRRVGGHWVSQCEPAPAQ